jgi:hypothetical protein
MFIFHYHFFAAVKNFMQVPAAQETGSNTNSG